ncbi:MAG: hypothetical protein JNK68_02950 [Betaproteobacteria bacterium]|nr:hypothetical protein [Betaproteobacteria bacterium]
MRKLITQVGAELGPVYGKYGKASLREKRTGYVNAARRAPWIVLVDLDHDAPCPPPLRSDWVPVQVPFLCFRVAVRAVEAWLLADADALAAFLGVSRNRIPRDPESLQDPKTAMVNLARASRRTAIRADMVPRDGSGRPIGPAYASRLIEFASSPWRPDIAAQRSDSLRRALACLEKLTNVV